MSFFGEYSRFKDEISCIIDMNGRIRDSHHQSKGNGVKLW